MGGRGKRKEGGRGGGKRERGDDAGTWRRGDVGKTDGGARNDAEARYRLRAVSKREIGRWRAKREKSRSVVKIGTERRSATAVIKKSTGEPAMPALRHRLKCSAARTWSSVRMVSSGKAARASRSRSN